MINAGRPLRFLALIVTSWIALRIVMLWPSADSVPALIRGIVPRIAAAEPAARPAAVAQPVNVTPKSPVPAPAPNVPAIWRTALRALPRAPLHRAPDAGRIALALVGLLHFGETQVAGGPPGMLLPPAPDRPRRSRWSGSGWLVVRDGRGFAPGFGTSQLGGAQAGVRIAYLLDRRHRVATVARVASPLSGRGREAAIGIEWTPTELPVRLVAEQRISLDGGRGGPTVGAIAGVGPTPIVAGVMLEAYGQAGAIARDGIEGFADGAVRLAHPLARIGTARLDMGAGLWGAAQRGAERLDAGPSLSLDVPVSKAHVRVSLDWRQRIAGNARPGSGPVLSIGTDF